MKTFTSKFTSGLVAELSLSVCVVGKPALPVSGQHHVLVAADQGAHGATSEEWQLSPNPKSRTRGRLSEGSRTSFSHSMPPQC